MNSRAIRITMVTCMAIAGAPVTSPVHAQEDYRNVDENRPLRIEDAYPIKFGEWEWELGVDGLAVEGGTFGARKVGELKIGIRRNFEVGIETAFEWERVSGNSQAGLGEVEFHALYNFNQGKRAPTSVRDSRRRDNSRALAKQGEKPSD